MLEERLSATSSLRRPATSSNLFGARCRSRSVLGACSRAGSQNEAPESERARARHSGTKRSTSTSTTSSSALRRALGFAFDQLFAAFGREDLPDHEEERPHQEQQDRLLEGSP